jgi:hypothetical protein
MLVWGRQINLNIKISGKFAVVNSVSPNYVSKCFIKRPACLLFLNDKSSY